MVIYVNGFYKLIMIINLKIFKILLYNEFVNEFVNEFFSSLYNDYVMNFFGLLVPQQKQWRISQMYQQAT